MLISFIAKPAFTQVPSKQEMQNQMAQAIKELNDQIADLENQIAEAKKNKEDDSVIKELQDQVTMLKKQVEMMDGVTKALPNMSDKKIQQAVADDNKTEVPKKDVARIKMIPDKTFTDAELVVFIQKVFLEIDKKTPPLQKNNGKELYDEINVKEKSPALTGNIGVQCWMAGATDKGLYLLGRSCVDDPNNTDNLCNYASCLSMVGGEHLAIPILQNLHKKFPGNTTILNNLGQASYGLGDMNNASRYLDSTVHFLSAHPLADETRSEIQEAQGRDQESIESLKRSIKPDYTPEKEARLNKKGVILKHDDIDETECSKAKNTTGTAQTLGIEKFLFGIPEYPYEGGETAEISRMEWYDFRQKLNEAKSKIEEEIVVLKEKAKQYENKLVQVNGSQSTSNSALLKPYNTKQHKTSSRKLVLLNEWASERMIAIANKIMAADDTIRKWRVEYNEAMMQLMKSSNGENMCPQRKALATSFNMKANILWHQRNNEWLDFHKEYLNTEARLLLCATIDRSLYELGIANIKSTFLTCLAGLRCELEVGCILSEPEKPMGKVLPDYDEMNCQYKTELSIPYARKIFSIKVECNKMTTDFDLKFIKGSLDENLATGKYKGRVEIEQKIGSDDVRLGPVKMGGAKLSAGAGVEFTEGGIQDVYITGRGQIKAGGVTMSTVDARVSVITGNSSVTGGGALSGITIK